MIIHDLKNNSRKRISLFYESIFSNEYDWNGTKKMKKIDL